MLSNDQGTAAIYYRVARRIRNNLRICAEEKPKERRTSRIAGLGNELRTGTKVGIAQTCAVAMAWKLRAGRNQSTGILLDGRAHLDKQLFTKVTPYWGPSPSRASILMPVGEGTMIIARWHWPMVARKIGLC